MADGDFFPRWLEPRYRRVFKLMKAGSRPEIVGAALSGSLKEPWAEIRAVPVKQFVDAARAGQFDVIDELTRGGAGDRAFRESLAEAAIAMATGQPEFLGLAGDREVGKDMCEQALGRMARTRFLDRINARMVDMVGADASAQFSAMQDRAIRHARLAQCAEDIVAGKLARPVSPINGGKLGTSALLGDSTDRKLRGVGA